MVGSMVSNNLCLAVVGSWICMYVTRAENQKACWMTPDDSYRKYKCVKISEGVLPLMICQQMCCSRHRCIGTFHNSSSEQCYLISSTVKADECTEMDWGGWTAYKKKKDLGTCGSLLFETIGYYHLTDQLGVDAEHSRLNSVPVGDEIGGYVLDTLYLIVKLSASATVRGIATQGRWRNETLDSCCDDRITKFFLHGSVDCDSAWVFSHVDVNRVFEANVIPDAGNEIVVNVFDEPLVGKCFVMYKQDYDNNPVIRWDLVGC